MMEQTLKMIEGGAAFLFALLLGVKWYGFRHDFHTRRRPVNEKLLRGPGESLRKEVQKWNERLSCSILAAAFVAVITPTALPNLMNPVSLLILFGAIGIALIPSFLMLTKYRAHDLGLSGERAVGQELNQLMLDGYHVFHDYPAGPNWNIDHIVVGPSGVYAIETKAVRKNRPNNGGVDYKITFDGNVLRFPCWTTKCGLEQTRRNAAFLRKQFSGALAEGIEVQAILTFPGWWIEETAKSDVSVVNPKRIRGLIVNGGAPRLTQKQIEQIAFKLEEKCRDLEF